MKKRDLKKQAKLEYNNSKNEYKQLKKDLKKLPVNIRKREIKKYKQDLKEYNENEKEEIKQLRGRDKKQAKLYLKYLKLQKTKKRRLLIKSGIVAFVVCLVINEKIKMKNKKDEFLNKLCLKKYIRV